MHREWVKSTDHQTTRLKWSSHTACVRSYRYGKLSFFRIRRIRDATLLTGGTRKENRDAQVCWSVPLWSLLRSLLVFLNGPALNGDETAA